ncbi:MAG: hypothetical protein IK082_05070 [Oscillospiraceae bacterium]|nr:hypothetical protein [Oscillospiraceae bacterium]
MSVDNVLIAPMSTEDVISELNLTGKHAVYQLGIPKGDTHNWVNAKVSFFGETWKTIGFPEEGQEEMIPLSWNRKVKVERWNDEAPPALTPEPEPEDDPDGQD